MAPFDDLPLPHLDPVPRIGAILRGERVGAIRLPPGVVPPVGRRLRSTWQRRREGPEAPPEEAPAEPGAGAGPPPPLEAAPPETYGEHGELHHPHAEAEAEAERPHLDLEA